MKNCRFFALGLCFLLIVGLFGCGKEFSSANITRDDLRVGGSLSFVYDNELKRIYVGGKDEVIQYSEENTEKGYSAGNRVGIKVYAPDEKIKLDETKLEIDGVKYSGGEFYQTIDGQKQRFFVIYPSFSKNDMRKQFSVVWQDGAKKQTYEIVIAHGTSFMGQNGEIV